MGQVVTGKGYPMRIMLSCLVFSVIIFSGSPVLPNPPRTVLMRQTEKMAVGTILALERNTLEIYDETDGTVKRFVYLDPLRRFQTGDRVRLYYSPDRSIKLIKKMTPLTYAKDGQNLGYIMRGQ